MIDEGEIERVLERLERLRAAVIDASSIIYIEKSGYYGKLANTIKLMTIPAVIGETGMPELDVEIVEASALRESTDRQLFATAVSLGKPLISEDRAILLRCREGGMEYYNAYMMLLMLRLRRVIGENELLEFRARLIEAAHYGGQVLDYADSFVAYLAKAL